MTRKAVAHLTKQDKILGKLITAVSKKHGHYKFEQKENLTHFHYILRCIVSQQLSTKAAATIFGRFLKLYPKETPTPALVLKTSEEKFQSVGLSRQKRSYILDVAAKAADRSVDFENLHMLTDAEVIESLTRIKGIGVWTAQIFLMFKLGRTDILPPLDLGIQKAVQRAYGMKRKALPKDVERVSKLWTPYRTIAAWYLWRSLELE